MGTKQDKILEFYEWIDEISEKSNCYIKWEDDTEKQIARFHITNPTNMRRIKRNIEYIVNDPRNIEDKAPNDWHKLSHIRKDNNTVYTMDINGKDRMAYIVKDNVIIFSMIGHLE
jgi:Txe/YoeB family toxin of Txe-Axe toxin-antitoxin module